MATSSSCGRRRRSASSGRRSRRSRCRSWQSWCSTRQRFAVSALVTIEFLPFILFSLPAGVWVDRLRRKPILVIGDVGRAVLLASVPVAYLADALTIWQLYVVGFGVGVLTVLFDVAYMAYLPSLVEREQLVEGNSKLEISRSAAQIGGPGSRRRPRRGVHRAVRGARGRDQLRRLCALPPPHPPAGAAARGARRRTTTVDAARRPGGPRLRARQSLPASDRDVHGHLEPVRQHGVRDPARVRGPHPRNVRGPDRDRVRPRQCRHARGRSALQPHHRASRRRADDRRVRDDVRAGTLLLPAAPDVVPRAVSRRLDALSDSRASSTTSRKSPSARRSRPSGCRVG